MANAPPIERTHAHQRHLLMSRSVVWLRGRRIVWSIVPIFVIILVLSYNVNLSVRSVLPSDVSVWSDLPPDHTVTDTPQEDHDDGDGSLVVALENTRGYNTSKALPETATAIAPPTTTTLAGDQNSTTTLSVTTDVPAIGMEGNRQETSTDADPKQQGREAANEVQQSRIRYGLYRNRTYPPHESEIPYVCLPSYLGVYRNHFPITPRGALDFTVHIDTNIKILMIGDSVGDQYAYWFERACGATSQFGISAVPRNGIGMVGIAHVAMHGSPAVPIAFLRTTNFWIQSNEGKALPNVGECLAFFQPSTTWSLGCAYLRWNTISCQQHPDSCLSLSRSF